MLPGWMSPRDKAWPVSCSHMSSVPQAWIEWVMPRGNISKFIKTLMGRLKNICSQKHISNLSSKAGIRENTYSTYLELLLILIFSLYFWEFSAHNRISLFPPGRDSLWNLWRRQINYWVFPTLFFKQASNIRLKIAIEFTIFYLGPKQQRKETEERTPQFQPKDRESLHICGSG